MILVDTSVWVDHLRHRNRHLEALLLDDRAVTHPFVIGELACGRLHPRAEILRLLGTLPAAPLASHDDVLTLIEQHGLAGTGIGWVDAHLLASALLAGAPLMTLDRTLARSAARLGLES